MTGVKLKRLGDLRNVGKAMLADFNLLGIERVEQLAECEPRELYDRLQAITGHRHDPCVLDTFMAATDFMRGAVAAPWWKYTPMRKATFGAI